MTFLPITYQSLLKSIHHQVSARSPMLQTMTPYLLQFSIYPPSLVNQQELSRFRRRLNPIASLLPQYSPIQY